MIETNSLRVDYDDVTAVHDLDLKVGKGQIYGLVGPNGAGKTSTIKAIAGIIEPTYGEIKIADVDLEFNPQQALKHLGYMPDFPPVYENLKVWEYLDCFATAYLIPGVDRPKRIKYWIERVNLESKYDAFVHTLSRGMRQRLVLAKTLLHEPSVLLLDEPASGMDPIARLDLRNILKEVASKGATVVISSHILTELSDFCTAVGIMEKGRMVVSGTMQEIRTRLGSRGRLHIKLVKAEERVRSAFLAELKRCPLLVEPVEKALGEYEAFFTGMSPEAAHLLKNFVQQDYVIADFHLQEEDVEDIFLKVGAREVS